MNTDHLKGIFCYINYIDLNKVLDKSFIYFRHSRDHEAVAVVVLLVVALLHHVHVQPQDRGVHDEAFLEVQDVRSHALDPDHHVKISTLINKSR